MQTFILGRREKALREDLLRRGTLSFMSRRGVRPVDRALIEALPKAAPTRILTGLDTEGALVLAARAVHPSADVRWYHFDVYLAEKVAATLCANDADASCAQAIPDLPGFVRGGEPTERFDLIALPFPSGGEALFAREIIEEAHDLLTEGGKLLASTDRRPDWLIKVAREVFGKVDVVTQEDGSVIHAVRRSARPAWKDHAHVIRLEARARAFEFETRAGVFSYGHADRGTKELLAAAEIPAKARILDIGCGYGVLGIVAAALSGGTCVLVDSSARATDLAQRNLARAGLVGSRVELKADPSGMGDECFDVVLANPPYFSDFRIAEAFIRGAHRALVDGGALWLVAKAVAEHAQRVEEVFGDADQAEEDGYGIIHAVRR